MERRYSLAAVFLAIGLWSASASAGVTGSAGGGGSLSTVQPSLAINYVIRTVGLYPSDGGAGGVGCLGEVSMFAGNFAPGGYQFCRGQLMPISQYEALYSLIGTTYGGDGISNFAMPDLRGRVAVGTGTGPGLSPRLLGQTGGAQSVTLTASNLPSHSHVLPPPGTVTGSTGSGSPSPFSNLQPEMDLNYLIALQGVFPSSSGGQNVGADPLIGQLLITADNVVPQGWARCNGQLLSIAQNTALFSVVGTYFGGNGQTTFGLPDLRGRAPIGIGQGPGLTQQSWGEVMGTETVSLTESQLPSHTHAVAGMSGPTTIADGGGQAHSTMQPTLGLNYIIATQGLYPSRDEYEGTTDEPLIGQIELFAGYSLVPDGWAICDGSLLSISSHAALFSLLGTTYGGNGQTNFGLPDLRGRLAMDSGQGAGLSNVFLGEESGSENEWLGISEMPGHTHPYEVPEPATLCFLAAAGAMAGLRGRRAGLQTARKD